MTTVLVWLWMAFVVIPMLLGVLYVAGIQYQAGGVCLGLAPLALIAWAIDIPLNWSVFIVYLWDIPKRSLSEWTISQRLARVISESGRMKSDYLRLALALNALCPHQDHVKFKGVAHGG
ncbi:MAG: hypothetical protein V4718_04565 [Pseudomonadota bacterium]